MDDRILVKNISKSFGTHEVIRDFSIDIPLSGVTVIRGASGLLHREVTGSLTRYLALAAAGLVCVAALFLIVLL